MCGRFHNHLKNMHNWVDVLKDWPMDAALSYNVSPTQPVPIVVDSGAITARWGLVPAWEKEFSTKYPTHNARLETAKDKPSFRSAWKHSRTCLIPVAGFYEWRNEGSIKQPYFIHKPDDLLIFAGLWQPRNEQASFTILTTESQGNIKQLHHRMPVMLNQEHAAQWLDQGTSYPRVLESTSVFESIDFYGVSTEVNRSSSEGPALIEKI
jgi:putative SOS response-associated peptidase YedK